LRLGEGSALGTLCVLDRQPRTLTARQLDGLQMLARHIVRELRLRRDLAEARRQVAPERLPVQPGELLQGRWRLVRPIGEGSVGVVFEAYERSGARVALKFLRPAWMVHRLVVERFVREARILTRISSPHVSRILDVGNLPDARGNIPFLVMEYLEGTDLEAVRRRSDRVPWPRVVAWALDLCAALTEIHALDIVHRDLKPSNVFLSQGDDGTEVIKLVDFGIAKETIPASEEPLTEVDRLLGSVPYMSPEQLKSSRDVDARSDLWSLGVLLHELLTGQLPFPGETVLAICATVLSRPPLPMRASGVELPAGLESIVRRCLQREPGERYASAQALAEALRPLLRDPRAAS
ncbi:MAG: serine/threonine protein kinase, partial [Myxococcales bacterium]